jgi:hypothetical protein
MAISRVLYAAQTVSITTNAATYLLPVQSASADETIPVDDVLVLGKLGAAGRLQKDVAACKCTIKGYICSTVTPVAGASSTAATDNVLNDMLEEVRADSIAGTPIVVTLKSNDGSSALSLAGGFSFEGAASSVGIDISKGNFAMIDMAFDGVGQIDSLSMGASSVKQDASNSGKEYVDSAVPVTSDKVGLPNNADATDTVANLKFSFDMPTETLSRLGGVILGATAAVKTDNVTFSKPPFKSSLTLDGQSLSNTATVATAASTSNQMDAFDLNDLEVQLIGSTVSARSMNNAVGDIGATFSITVEGTDARFGTANQPAPAPSP